MNIQAEKEILDNYLWHAGKILGIEPKEVRARIRDACDRTRKFYRWIVEDYERELRATCMDHNARLQKAARLRRLGLSPNKTEGE